MFLLEVCVVLEGFLGVHPGEGLAVDTSRFLVLQGLVERVDYANEEELTQIFHLFPFYHGPLCNNMSTFEFQIFYSSQDFMKSVKRSWLIDCYLVEMILKKGQTYSSVYVLQFLFISPPIVIRQDLRSSQKSYFIVLDRHCQKLGLCLGLSLTYSHIDMQNYLMKVRLVMNPWS